MNSKPLSPPQEKSVFEQVKKERTPSKKMDVKEIIAPAAERMKMSPEDFFQRLSIAVNQDPKIRVVRANNTLFIYYNMGNGHVKIEMETADKPRELVSSFKEFSQTMKLLGFKSGEFAVQNPQILKAIEMSGSKTSTKSSNQLMPDGKTPMLTGFVEF